MSFCHLEGQEIWRYSIYVNGELIWRTNGGIEFRRVDALNKNSKEEFTGLQENTRKLYKEGHIRSFTIIDNGDIEHRGDKEDYFNIPIAARKDISNLWK